MPASYLNIGFEVPRTCLSSEIKCTGKVAVIPGESIVETLVELTGENDVHYIRPTDDSTLTQLLSGTVPAGLAKKRAGGATQGATTRERGSKDGSASRLSSSRESSALSNDSEAQPASGRGRSETPPSLPTYATPS